MKGISSLVLSVVVGTLMFSASPVEAKIYKCISPSGGVSYSQSPCAAEAKTSKVLQGKSVRERFDCRLTRAFSSQAAREMKAGVTYDQLFTRYGGANAVPSTAKSVLKYVYSYENQADTSVNQIVALAGARCESGAHSRNTDCDHFPASYLESAGGCSAIKGEVGRLATKTKSDSRIATPASAAARSAAVNSYPGGRDRAKQLELKTYNGQKDSVADGQTQCRSEIKQTITALQERMQGRLSLDERKRLNSQRAGLRRAFEAC